MSSTDTSRGSFASALHGICLSFPVALFAMGLASDVAYLNTAEIQWTNFASWSIAGALLLGALVVVWALADWLAHLFYPNSAWRLFYWLLVTAMWGVGLVNAFHHARDGWSSVGMTGLTLSLVSTLLALVAGWTFFSGLTRRDMIR